MNSNFKQFIVLPDNAKQVLLHALGYEVDATGYIIDSKTSKKVVCKYSQKPVLFKEASILPGSTTIINTNLITISEYISEYLEQEDENYG